MIGCVTVIFGRKFGSSICFLCIFMGEWSIFSRA